MSRTALVRLFAVVVLWIGAPAVARAQIDDPGLDAPPPPAPSPTPTAAAKASAAANPSPSGAATTGTPIVIPGADQPPKVSEREETNVKWIDGGGEAEQAEGSVYDRVTAPSLSGPIGLFRTLTGEVGRPLSLRVGLHMQFFTQNSFLIAGSSAAQADSHSRFLGDLIISFTPWKYLDTYLAVFNASNKNDRVDPARTDPTVILALGDLGFGAKAAIPLANFIDLGLHVGVRLLTSVNGVTFDGSSTNVTFDALSTFDFQRKWGVPLRAHINFGYIIDNSLSMLHSLDSSLQCNTSTSADACIRSRVVETFSYGINSPRFRIAVALDAPFTIAKRIGLQPLLEYHLEVATGNGDQVLGNALASSLAGTDALDRNITQYMVLGLRARPVGGLSIDLGLDIGLTSPGFRYGPPTPPWNLILGATYAYDTGASTGRTKLVNHTVVRNIEVARGPVEGRIRGRVIDASSKRALGGVIIKYLNQKGSPQATTDDGGFVSYGFQSGGATIEASRDDYETARVQVGVTAGAETPVEIRLTSKPPAAGTVRGRITDEAGNAVVAAVRLTGTSGSIIEADGEGGGAFHAQLPAGDYTLSIDAPGYLAKERPVSITAGQVQTIEVSLRKRPARVRVTIGKGEIQIKDTVHFNTNTAQILPDGEQLLDEVADVMVKNPQVKRVRIEGHTDNRGGAEKNLQLSKGRAASVKAYLIKSGIDPLRLESEGYGATQPLVPNLTAANRAKNRRVAFRILE